MTTVGSWNIKGEYRKRRGVSKAFPFKSLNSDTLPRITGRGFGLGHAQNSGAI